LGEDFTTLHGKRTGWGNPFWVGDDHMLSVGGQAVSSFPAKLIEDLSDGGLRGFCGIDNRSSIAVSCRQG